MLVDNNRVDQGTQQLNRAVDILEKLVQSHPQQIKAKVFLRNARQNRAFANLRNEEWKTSLADIERAMELDDGSNGARYRQHKLICECHLDPIRGLAAAEELMNRNDLRPGDQFAAARALAQISGTHPDESIRKKSAERAVQLLTSLNDAGFLRDGTAANLELHIEFRHLSDNPDFKSIAEIQKN